MNNFFPEGILINSKKNKEYLSSIEGLKRAKNDNIILEATAILCDNAHNLKVDICGVNAFIKRDEVALGIKQGTVRDIAIISRVGLPVCFKIVEIDESTPIPTVLLSRVLAQKDIFTNYISLLRSGDIIFGKITHLENFGAFVDIGCGVISMIGIENISVSRINHPIDRFEVGQEIYAVVLENKGDKIVISHKELLGSWQENAQKLTVDTTVTGIIRSIEHYGIFIELSPNLSGLAEFKDGFNLSDNVSVHIKSINEEKMKIKLNIINKIENSYKKPIEYFIKHGNISSFNYSPSSCSIKKIGRLF